MIETSVEYVWMGDFPLAQIDSSGNIVYIHSDQVNNPQKITNASRTLVWDREQEPFGETYATPTNTTPTNLRFPGQYADAENLLSYNLMRDYDNTIARYIQSDPSGFNGGLNIYEYGLANPTRWIDPTGEASFVAGGAEVAPLLDATITAIDSGAAATGAANLCFENPQACQVVVQALSGGTIPAPLFPALLNASVTGTPNATVGTPDITKDGANTNYKDKCTNIGQCPVPGTAANDNENVCTYRCTDQTVMQTTWPGQCLPMMDRSMLQPVP